MSAGKGQLGAGELQGLREVAAAAAGRGTALTALITEYLDSACRVWSDLPGACRAEGVDALAAVATAHLRAVADATVALTEGYETAYRAAIRGEEATRREFVDDLLEGRTNLGRLPSGLNDSGSDCSVRTRSPSRALRTPSARAIPPAVMSRRR
ncbi:hypothetical protein [Streptomyces sp. F001]|uniref:hypothetical protein n=1 Tax=Streptomyces sp. F001 TaxID=1510026 RepID=UPI001F0FAE31|nr:hypothetical protein [Streptomyces sp. F001]